MSLVRQGYASARAVTRGHAKSFYFASVALLGARRRAAFALYAFCRRLDDLVDGCDTTHPSCGLVHAERVNGAGSKTVVLAERLAHAREVVSRVFRGEPVSDTGVFDRAELAALSDAVARFGIPEAPMQELITGMEMDLEPRRYATWEELELYCHRAAGTVGLLMVPVLGGTGERAAWHAAELGKAMQLTNILRDVREDLERGRCYLPQDELRRFGLSESRLSGEGFVPFMQLQVARARELYRSGDAGIGYLGGFGCRSMVRIMSAVYAGILGVIEARAYDVLSARAFVPFSRKVVLAARALAAAPVLSPDTKVLAP